MLLFLTKTDMSLNIVIKLRPNFADAFVERGVVQRRMGRAGKFLEDFEMARRLEPEIPIPK